MNYRRVPFSHTQNTRDLGGYAVPNGVTRWNVFFRSACPVDFDSNDISLLKHLNIGVMIDLRGGSNADERLATPQGLAGVTRYTIPFGDGVAPRFAKDVPQSYMDMLQWRESLCKIFEIFAEAEGAVLFHCFAGKDRTGVIAALLLKLAGVSDVDVVADYSLTYPYFLKRLRSDFLRTDAEKYVFVPIPEHMEEFLRLFAEKYGTVSDFLSGIGVDIATQQKILNKFVQKSQR